MKRTIFWLWLLCWHIQRRVCAKSSRQARTLFRIRFEPSWSARRRTWSRRRKRCPPKIQFSSHSCADDVRAFGGPHGWFEQFSLFEDFGHALRPAGDKLSETDPKDKLVSALKASFDFCTQTLAKVDDSNLGEQLTLFGRGQQPEPER